MKQKFNRQPTDDERAEFRVRKPKVVRCTDRMCGAEDCPNCHPENCSPELSKQELRQEMVDAMDCANDPTATCWVSEGR